MNKYIATIDNDEVIKNFGEGETVQSAIDDFDFEDACRCNGFEAGAYEINVYVAVERGTDEFDRIADDGGVDTDENGFEWFLGNKVHSVNIEFIGD